MKNKSKYAFTLAEVIITLVVIGVIAALTIPMYTGNSIEKANRAKLKKTYSVLQGAFETLKDLNNIDYASVSNFHNADLTYTTDVINKLKKYLLVSKDCGHKTGCTAPKYYYKNRKVWLNNPGKNTAEDYALTLNDGTSIVFTMYVRNTVLNSYKLGINNSLIYDSNFIAVVDTNGASGPNTVSKDIFLFVLTKEGLLPAGSSNNSANCEKATQNYDGMDCAAKYIFDDN